MQERPCEREDIVAKVAMYDTYSVKGDGDLGYFLTDDNYTPSYRDEIVEYHCDNCGEYFSPEKKDDFDSLDEAWKAALAHLKVAQEVVA